LDLYEDEQWTRSVDKVYQITPLQISNDAITKTPLKENAYEDRLDSSILSSLIENDDVIKINPII
jgi:hypothetical protein